MTNITTNIGNGVDKVMNDATTAAEATLGRFNGVDKVYFSSFVIQ